MSSILIEVYFTAKMKKRIQLIMITNLRNCKGYIRRHFKYYRNLTIIPKIAVTIVAEGVTVDIKVKNILTNLFLFGIIAFKIDNNTVICYTYP